MKRKSRSIDFRLTSARLSINNSMSNPDIMTALAAYNYNEQRMKEGVELLEKADKLHLQNHIEKAGKLKAFKILKETRAEAAAVYNKHRQMARLILKDDPAAVLALGLKGSVSRTTGGWLEQAGQFYINALSMPAAARLKEYGIGTEMLQSGKKLVEKVEQAEADAEKAKGAALQATLKRNAALKELEHWVGILLRISRLAFKGGREQLLEALGIHIPG